MSTATTTTTMAAPASNTGNSSGASIPPQVLSIGIGFIASAFLAVAFGFFLRMYLARRRAAAAGDGPPPPWIDVFFSIVEHRGEGRENGRSASSGFLYFAPTGYDVRRFRARAHAKESKEEWEVPVLFECDVEVGNGGWGGEKEHGEGGCREEQLLSTDLQPMTTYNKSQHEASGDLSVIPQGAQIGISVLIQMPTPTNGVPHRHHSPADEEEDERPLPELSIGVLDLCVASPQVDKREWEPEQEEEEKMKKKRDWLGRDNKEKVQDEVEVVHLEYRT